MTFEEIYDGHKDMVFNLSLNYVQNYEDAEEITQDVFVSVYHSIEKFEEKSSITTWIYRITINKSLDHIKAKNRKKRFGLISVLLGIGDKKEPDVGHFNHPGVQLEQKDAIQNIFNCINELPDNQKTALLLSKTEQMSQGEIAIIMNLSVKAVESLIQRAKTNLAKKLEDAEG
jgi:RNA polymerase sigma-70 factor (ECF subfamily)